MRITFVTRKFGNVERNSHCDVLQYTAVRVARLVLDCNGVFAIKAYGLRTHHGLHLPRMIWHRYGFRNSLETLFCLSAGLNDALWWLSHSTAIALEKERMTPHVVPLEYGESVCTRCTQ